MGGERGAARSRVIVMMQGGWRGVCSTHCTACLHERDGCSLLTAGRSGSRPFCGRNRRPRLLQAGTAKPVPRATQSGACSRRPVEGLLRALRVRLEPLLPHVDAHHGLPQVAADLRQDGRVVVVGDRLGVGWGGRG